MKRIQAVLILVASVGLGFAVESALVGFLAFVGLVLLIETVEWFESGGIYRAVARLGAIYRRVHAAWRGKSN